jgi:hypothetical protein
MGNKIQFEEESLQARFGVGWKHDRKSDIIVRERCQDERETTLAAVGEGHPTLPPIQPPKIPMQ